jgi:hypothetical protein
MNPLESRVGVGRTTQAARMIILRPRLAIKGLEGQWAWRSLNAQPVRASRAGAAWEHRCLPVRWEERRPLRKHVGAQYKPAI